MWKRRQIDKEKEQKFISDGINPLVARIMSQRNGLISNPKEFIDAKYESLSHPYDIKGVKEAAELFCKVAKNNGKISCLTDYDCDGIVSATMLKELCTIFGLQCEVMLPDRSAHGYGLTTKTIEHFKKIMPYKPDLLIIADNGTNGEEGIKSIKEWSPNTRIVIIDHHIVDPLKFSKSADIVINWHQTNTQEMCAAGLVFQFVRGIRWLTKKVNPVEFLSYAAIATLADVSPIIGDNRIIVKNGLRDNALNHVVAQGLISLIRKSGIYSSTLTQEDVLFKISPRINAVGRLGKPDMAYKLLIEHDQSMSELMAENLNDNNNNRKKIQKKIAHEAEEMVKKNKDLYKHGIVVYNPEWPVGVIGIVASKLSETFFKPAIVIGKHKEVVKGSGRSVEQVNLKEILDGCSYALETYGGHKLAAGVTVKADFVDKINAIFNEECEKYYKIHGFPEEIRYYDASLKAGALSIKNANILSESLYPYCTQNNPEPVFLLSNAQIVDANLKEGDGWSLLTFNGSKDGVKSVLPFKMFSGEFGAEINGLTADIYFSFPQSTEKVKYFSPSLNVLDLVIKTT